MKIERFMDIYIVNDYGTSKTICIKLTLENGLVIINVNKK
jgi:hypothetical protein